MMEAVRAWLTSVVLVSVLLSAAQSLIPPGTVRKAAGFTGGLILLLVLLRPVLGADLEHLELDFDHYQAAVEERQEELADTQTEAMASIIAEQTEAYILDKAGELGLEVTVRVETRTEGNGIPVPWSAELTGRRWRRRWRRNWASRRRGRFGMSGKQKTEGVRRIWDKYKFVALVALAGAVLLLWPGGDGKTAERASPQAAALVEAELQQEMEDILGRIQGVGEVQVLLTVESDGERQLAQDSELSYSGSTAAPEDYSRSSQTVLVDDGSAEAPVVTRTVYPTYRGALVVCQGGDRADVKLAVTEAVAALTGLSADRITVAKSQ